MAKKIKNKKNVKINFILASETLLLGSLWLQQYLEYWSLPIPETHLWSHYDRCHFVNLELHADQL